MSSPVMFEGKIVGVREEVAKGVSPGSGAEKR